MAHALAARRVFHNVGRIFEHAAFVVADGAVTLTDPVLQLYTFDNSGPTGPDEIYSCNEFKKSNGVAGTLTNSSSSAKAGVSVQLLLTNKVVSTATSIAFQ